jgi:oligoendopeptidase F
MTETYEMKAWSLEDLFSARDAEDMLAGMQALESGAAEFEKHRPNLNDDISDQDFLQVVADLEALTKLSNRISAYAGLDFAADTQNQEAQTFYAQVDQLLAKINNRTLFFSLWWKGLEEDAADRLMAGSGDYRYWLEEMRNFKPHTLSEAEEKIINIKDVTGANALTVLYDSITNRYVFKVTVDGEELELTRGQLMVHVRGQDADVRAAAYQELYRVFGDDGPILGQIYQTLVRDWRNEQIDLRNFSSPIAVRNLRNDVPDEVVDTLLQVCEKNAGIFQRYFKLKARLLGMDRLRRYDVYAPVTASDKTYEFSDAVEIVLETFGEFDPHVAAQAKRVFDDDHLDSEIRKGKDSGAFCATVVPELTPWVLQSFQGKPDDVATLAHELGHAIHAMLAEDHNAFTQHSSLPLAETASTFSEMLLVDKLLAGEQDEAVRRDLLFRQVDDAYATIMRQAFFALFEREAHEMIHKNASVDELAEAYMKNLEDQFGDSLELSDEFRWEWVSIPHIYQVPFYVYAYAFGQLLVLALYQQYRSEGEAFKPRYLKILSAGGSDAPVRILSEAGIDVYSAEFWQGGFDVIADLIDQLEAMPPA